MRSLTLGLASVLAAITSQPVHAQGGVTRFCESGLTGATISATGSASFQANGGAGDLVLHASGLPQGASGLFFYGSAARPAVPLGSGFRCVASTRDVSRLDWVAAGPGDTSIAYPVDYQRLPAGAAAIGPGSTWNFQFWFRNGSSPDLTDALAVEFIPPVPISSMSTLVDLRRNSHPLGQTPGGGVVVINTAAELQATWDLTVSGFIPPPPVPAVDMSRVTVVAAYCGRRFTTGFDMEVRDIALSVTTLSVGTTETQPGSGCGGSFGESNPVHMVAIRKIENAQLGEWTPEIYLTDCP